MDKCSGTEVLFITKKRSLYGHDTTLTSSGLINSVKFVCDMLNRNKVHSVLVDVTDNNDIDRELTKYKPEICIIEALWVVPDKFIVLKELHPNVKFAVRIHSDIPFIANEGIAIQWLKKYSDYGVKVFCNSERIADSLKDVLEIDTEVLPNYYPITEVRSTDVPKGDGYIDIACFGAIRPLKNHLIQAMAAIKFANKKNKMLYFHINSTRVEGNAGPILKNLRNLFSEIPHVLVEHSWMDHDSFIDLMVQMDISMQVSFSETYNIVTADAINNKIPVVTSEEIDFVLPQVQAECTDIDDIVQKLKFAYKTRNLGSTGLNKIFLKQSNNKAERLWLEALGYRDKIVFA